MSIIIQKSSSGTFFTVQQPNDVSRDYLVNDYDLVPTGDNIHFSLVGRIGRNLGRVIINNEAYSNIVNGDTSIAFASFAALQTYIETNFFRNPGGNAGSTSQTGTALSFTSDAIYGTTGTPETGNITVVLTGAKLGVSVLLLHNNETTPTFDSAFKKSSSSGSYITGVLNYIDCQYIDDTHIRYSISQ